MIFEIHGFAQRAAAVPQRSRILQKWENDSFSIFAKMQKWKNDLAGERHFSIFAKMGNGKMPPRRPFLLKCKNVNGYKNDVNFLGLVKATLRQSWYSHYVRILNKHLAFPL